MRRDKHILTINGGSSSIKFSLYKIDKPLKEICSGQVENIGSANSVLSFHNSAIGEESRISINAANHDEAAASLVNWLKGQEGFDSLQAIGHRIVHGFKHTKPALVTPGLLEELKKMRGYDPEHLPEEISLIELFSQRYPAIKQVACFDTSFHATMPAVAKMLAIPRKYYDKGIFRYGFHGLSYAYLMQELESLSGKEVAQGKVILAHLGSGASIAAVHNGQSMDTSMGFTPVSGLPMSTRCGDIDPGIAWYLMEFEKLNATQFSHLINYQSGLLGISETSADMRQLQELEETDSRAAEAIEFFCYQTKKWVGAYAAALSGLETLVFAGGIGEHSPEVRSKICDGLEFLGIELCEIRNMNNESIISSGKSKVTVHVIKTNEELMIAGLVCDVLKLALKS